MIGKRRFVVIILSLAVVLATELVKGGMSATGVTAVSFIVGTYFGFDMGAKLKNGQG